MVTVHVDISNRNRNTSMSLKIIKTLAIIGFLPTCNY